MRKIIQYITGYVLWVDKRQFFLATLFTACLVFVNYYFGLNAAINRLSFAGEWICWTLVFAVAFGAGYLVQRPAHQSYFASGGFIPLFLFACILFAWKMSFPVNIRFNAGTEMNEYLNAVIYWPFKVLVVTGCLLAAWRKTGRDEPFYGISAKNYSFTPYLIMLLCMMPLVALAATRPDFLAAYPRYDNIALLKSIGTGMETLIFELSYGSDFFTIELFFRGFLVLAFAKWAGKGAILPMAMFYCTIHFGKPLGECISSFFGGLLLGTVTYHTRTIWGGLLVHVGIAWLMELAGYLVKY